MTCSCRIAPLRSFLSGLAQVHRLDPSSSPSSKPLLRNWSRAALPRTQNREVSAFRHLRGFHATTRAAREASASADEATDSPPSSSSSDAPAADSAVSEGVIEPTTTVQKQQPKSASSSSKQKKKKKKQRWRELDEPELAKLREEQAKLKEEAAKNQEKKAKKKAAKSMRSNAAGSDGSSGITEEKGVRTIRRKDGITISTRSTDGQSQSRAKAAGSHMAVEDVDSSTGEFKGEFKGQQEKLPDWRIQKEALKEKFPDGWRPRKRLSPDALAGIRALNAQYPDIYTTSALSAKFEVDPEAIRRILKSKWQPSESEEARRLRRWEKRGMQIWETKAALGIKPPKQWRQEGIARDPSWHAWRRKVVEREREWEDEERRVYREKRAAASLQSRVAGKVL